MHVHLFNCHGEWAMVAMVIANASLVGVWLRSKLGGMKIPCTEEAQ